MLLNLAILYHTIRCETRAIREVSDYACSYVWRSKMVELVVATESLRVYTVSRTSNAVDVVVLLATIALRGVVVVRAELACRSFMYGCKCLVASVRRCELHVHCVYNIHLRTTVVLPEA